jgi:hypothetical protein
MGEGIGKMAVVRLAQARKKSWSGAEKHYQKNMFKMSIKFRNNEFLNMFMKFNSECKNNEINISKSFILVP